MSIHAHEWVARYVYLNFGYGQYIMYKTCECGKVLF